MSRNRTALKMLAAVLLAAASVAVSWLTGHERIGLVCTALAAVLAEIEVIACRVVMLRLGEALARERDSKAHWNDRYELERQSSHRLREQLANARRAR